MGLFSPIQVGGVAIRNRIVKSAMVEGRCDPNGQPTLDFARTHEQWALGGVGLSITGMAMVVEGTSMTPHEMGLYSDDQIAPLALVADRVHAHGGRLFVQLGFAPPQVMRQTALRLGSPSISSGFNRATFTWNRQLRGLELLAIASAFGRAARRAQLAGVDGVQLHAAHGYLLSRTLSPRHNRRTDDFGGSHDRRMRMITEVVMAIQQHAGLEFPIAVKLNAHDGERGGMSLDDSIMIAKSLEKIGCSAIEVSAGTADVGLSFYPNKGEIPADWGAEFLLRGFPFLRPFRRWLPPIVRRLAKSVAFSREAYFVDEAKAIAESVAIPTIAVGGIRSLQTAQSIVDTSKIAMVALARPLVCQPDLAVLWEQSKAQTAACTSCNRCYVALGLGKTLECRKCEPAPSSRR